MAVLAGVIVGAFVVAPWFRTPSRNGQSASSLELPTYISLAQAVVDASSVSYEGTDDDDYYGPVKVYEAAVTAVHYQDERYGERIRPGESLRVVVPADLEAARDDATTDRSVGLMLSFRDVPEGEKLVSEWRLRGVFDKATHEFVGSVAHYNADLRAVLPNATTEELAAWAAEGAAVAAGEPGGEHTAAWEAPPQTALDHRGASWSTQDPRIRSLDPERMPEGRRNDVVGVVAIIELPEAIAGDPAFENLALSVRSDYGVVYQSALSIGTQYAVLWSRSHDAWRVDILEGDELEGITIGTIEPGGARDSDAMLLTISDVQLQGAIVALSTPGADGPSPTHIAVESMTRAQLDQRLAELAQQ